MCVYIELLLLGLRIQSFVITLCFNMCVFNKNIIKILFNLKQELK